MSVNGAILLLFVDGLGMGSDDPRINPISGNAYPNLATLLHSATPIDACLGVQGLPQSATGQTALLTGVNAAEAMGRHVEGFPGEALREIIREQSIFARLSDRGLRATFANAYYLDDSEQVRVRRRLQSVTTVMTLECFHRVRDKTFLDRNEAVYHDLTRESLVPRGYTGPVITPRGAAEHLAAIACRHDLTLFEYFLTDRAAHAGDPVMIGKVLAQYDEFLEWIMSAAKRDGFSVLLTSDHGNIEDSRTRRHTANPVPFIVFGPAAEFFEGRVRALTDVCPLLVEWFSQSD